MNGRALAKTLHREQNEAPGTGPHSCEIGLFSGLARYGQY